MDISRCSATFSPMVLILLMEDKTNLWGRRKQIVSNYIQKQPSRGVNKKKSNLKICIIEITLRHGCCPGNLLHIFKTPFTRITSGGLFLYVILDVILDGKKMKGFPLHSCFPFTLMAFMRSWFSEIYVNKI